MTAHHVFLPTREVTIMTDETRDGSTNVSEQGATVSREGFGKPVISYPTSGSSVKGPVIHIGGFALATGAWVEVFQVVGTDRVKVAWGAAGVLSWSATWISSSGMKTIVAKYRNSEFESEPVTFTYEYEAVRFPPPSIDSHESTVDTTVLIQGTGSPSAIVRTYRDGTEDLLGSSVVGYVGNDPGPFPERWRMQLYNLPAGNFTITATQTTLLGTSPRSEPLMLRVRPPLLANIAVTFPTNNTVKFSGAGYLDAKVEITVISPSGATPPPVVDVVNGSWETTATGWQLGDYTLKAIQSVVDHAGGRIESQANKFCVKVLLLPPTEVIFDTDYRPTFSGKGYTGATVSVKDQPGGIQVAPSVEVRNGVWSTRASSVWGPTWQRLVRVVQQMGDLTSDPVDIPVTIEPSAPVITGLEDNGFSPSIFSTCWPGAVVNLKFDDDNDSEHRPDVTNGSWTFRRETDFALGVTHTVTVTQTVAQQTSLSASETFTVQRQLLKPVITHPLPNEEVGSDLIVQGKDGIAGATMQLRDAQFGSPLGEPVLLSRYGVWSVELKGLAFRPHTWDTYTIDAVQVLDGLESDRSDFRTFKVVLLSPQIEVPQPGSDQPRTSIISGSAMPGGRVNVWLQGSSEPLLSNRLVDDSGYWEGAITLPVGVKVIWATQTFADHQSTESPRLTYNVVPAAPFIETPAEDESTEQQVTVSGFGYEGDAVTVRLEDAPDTVLGQVTVLEDRSWSVSVMIDRPGGSHRLIAVQSRDGFDSARSPERSIRMGAYLPQIDVPAEGTRVTDPVVFEGQGQPGVGEVTAWFNPDEVLADAVGIADGVWRATSRQALRPGGQWVRFHQSLLAGGKSAWAESQRFEVDPPEPPRE